MERLRPEDLLLVVSPFGMEPLSLPKRLLERALGNQPERQPRACAGRVSDGIRARRPSGPAAARVGAGRGADRALFFGLPIGRDMDGFARTDLFTPRFTATRPLAFIPTHER